MDGAAKRKTKRRLLDLVVEEISAVDAPAIGRSFVLVKRDGIGTTGEAVNKENAMKVGPQIKKAREDKGLDLEKLAEMTEIAVDVLTKLEADDDVEISEEQLAKIASALDLEALDAQDAPLADKPDATKPDATKPDASPSPDKPTATAHMELLTEKLTAIATTAQELLDSLPKKSLEDVQKALGAMSSVIWSVRDTAEVALLTKRVDDGIKAATTKDDLLKVMDGLREAMSVAFAAAPAEVSKTEVSKTEPSEPTPDEGSEAEIAELKKKIAALEKAGVSKSLPDDDDAAGVRKGADGVSWGFLGKDIPSA